MLLTKNNNIFFSNLLSKFINTLIFFKLKQKMETFIYNCLFIWKKLLNTCGIFYFFESLLKVRPLIGFYIYVIKKKKKKIVKIKPYYMSFVLRWQKAIYWFTRSIKMEMGKQKFIINFFNEIYNIVFFQKSNSLKQKTKYYKTIFLFKTSKNFKW